MSLSPNVTPKIYPFFLALLLSSILLAGCSNAAPAPAQAEVVLQATEFRFEPATVQVTAGRPVQLVLKNDGNTPHDVAVVGLDAEVHEAMMGDGGDNDHEAPGGMMSGADHNTMMAEHAGEAKVHANAEPGKAAAIEFTPAMSGAYQFVCTIPGHKEAGMVGQLIVQDGKGTAR